MQTISNPVLVYQDNAPCYRGPHLSMMVLGYCLQDAGTGKTGLIQKRVLDASEMDFRTMLSTTSAIRKTSEGMSKG